MRYPYAMRAFFPCLALSAAVLLAGCGTTPPQSSSSSPTRTTPYSNLSPDQASDIAIQAREMVKARERIAGTIAHQPGKPLEVVLEDIERDRWMSAEEAVDYGLVSRVIEHKTALKG